MTKQATHTIEEMKTPDVTVFARHETFHPRFGWLKKGFDRAAQNPNIFLAEDAPVQLGVGKNMVRSIRYWCNAFDLLEEDRPTDSGQALLGESGWDPYLEDPASLWLLHWQLLQPPCYATTWDFSFNHFRPVEFTYEDLFYALCEYRDRKAPRTADSSIKKDASRNDRLRGTDLCRRGLQNRSNDSDGNAAVSHRQSWFGLQAERTGALRSH